jgi:hypothetical protein
VLSQDSIGVLLRRFLQIHMVRELCPDAIRGKDEKITRVNLDHGRNQSGQVVSDDPGAEKQRFLSRDDTGVPVEKKPFHVPHSQPGHRLIVRIERRKAHDHPTCRAELFMTALYRGKGRFTGIILERSDGSSRGCRRFFTVPQPIHHCYPSHF